MQTYLIKKTRIHSFSVSLRLNESSWTRGSFKSEAKKHGGLVAIDPVAYMHDLADQNGHEIDEVLHSHDGLVLFDGDEPFFSRPVHECHLGAFSKNFGKVSLDSTLPLWGCGE